MQLPPCTADTKQKALYLTYTFSPPLQHSPALDIAVEHEWNSTADLKRWGRNGVFAAQPFGMRDGPGGYFGSQVFGAVDQDGGLLLSIWDRLWPSADVPRCMAAGGPNETWCEHQHAFPLSPSCRRHCLDCGLHPGWHNTTGVQCSLPMRIVDGAAVRFRLWRSAARARLPDPLGMGLPPYSGSKWQLTVEQPSAASSPPAQLVGEVFLEETYEGVSRFGAFHEHIGCVPCAAFYESEVRRGPWVRAPQPAPRVVCAASCVCWCCLCVCVLCNL